VQGRCACATRKACPGLTATNLLVIADCFPVPRSCCVRVSEACAGPPEVSALVKRVGLKLLTGGSTEARGANQSAGLKQGDCVWLMRPDAPSHVSVAGETGGEGAYKDIYIYRHTHRAPKSKAHKRSFLEGSPRRTAGRRGASYRRTHVDDAILHVGVMAAELREVPDAECPQSLEHPVATTEREEGRGRGGGGGGGGGE